MIKTQSFATPHHYGSAIVGELFDTNDSDALRYICRNKSVSEFKFRKREHPYSKSYFVFGKALGRKSVFLTQYFRQPDNLNNLIETHGFATLSHNRFAIIVFVIRLQRASNYQGNSIKPYQTKLCQPIFSIRQMNWKFTIHSLKESKTKQTHFCTNIITLDTKKEQSIIGNTLWVVSSVGRAVDS